MINPSDFINVKLKSNTFDCLHLNKIGFIPEVVEDKRTLLQVKKYKPMGYNHDKGKCICRPGTKTLKKTSTRIDHFGIARARAGLWALRHFLVS